MIDEAAKKGDVAELAALLGSFPQPEQLSEWYTDADYSTSSAPEQNARKIITRMHYFDTWDDYEAFRTELLDTNSNLARFEEAADAIAEGNIASLKKLLANHPELIKMRSPRNHHSTLLNYVGANGFEGWRQKTPRNAVEIAQVLLDSGAEVDAWGDMYGGTSTLGLVATSVHPVIYGVQEPLMDILIRHGADPNHAVASDYTGGMLILACIHNGRYEPIHYLAEHGAQIDLEGACALGDLEKVEALFDSNTEQKRNIGLTWACQYGHREVVDFLLAQDIPVNVYVNGTTPLLAAAFDGQLDLVKNLMDRGGDIEAKNDFGGTALGQTLWCLYNSRKPQHLQIMELLIASGAVIYDGWQQYIDGQRSQNK